MLPKQRRKMQTLCKDYLLFFVRILSMPISKPPSERYMQYAHEK